MCEFEIYLLDSTTWHKLCCLSYRISIQIKIINLKMSVGKKEGLKGKHVKSELKDPGQILV
jgi:hypothetical protein